MRASSCSNAVVWRSGIVAGRLGVHPHGEHTVLGVAEIDVLQVDERPHQQAGAHKQRQRQRELPHDHGLADAQPRGRSGDASALFAQSRHRVGLRDPQRRQQAEDETGSQRQPEDEVPTRRSSAAGSTIGSDTRRSSPSRSRKAAARPATPPAVARHRLSVNS